MIETNFIERLNKISKATQKLPAQAAVTAVKFSKERFVKKNWVDRNRELWDKNKRKKRKGSVLVQTGRLKKSIRKLAWGSNYILIGTDVPYAQIHNEGGKLTATVRVGRHKRKSRAGRMHDVKAHARKMNTTIPKRQFIGQSAVLMRRIERLIEKELKKALQ